MHQDEIRLLFTSAGRRVEAIRLFAKAGESLGLQTKIVATNLDPMSSALRVADQSYCVPPVSSDGYLEAIQRICKKENIDIIFPMIDPDVDLLGMNRATFKADGALVATVGEEFLPIVLDKWKTTQYFEKLGLAVPKSWLPDTLPTDGLSFPLFIKPRQGSASKDTYRVDDREELDFFLKRVPDPIIQEYVEGREITTDVVRGSDGSLLMSVSRERLVTRAGEVAIGKTIKHAEIAKACETITAAMQAVGPTCVQCFLRGDTPIFTEVNARLGGGFPLSIAAGGAGDQALLSQLKGVPFEVPATDAYQENLIMSRYDQSFFFQEGDLESIDRIHP